MHITLNCQNLIHILLPILVSLCLHHGVDGHIYGDACKKNGDCKDTKWCNPETWLCDCFELKIKGVSTIQIFHSEKRSCFSPAGSMCFRQEMPFVYLPKCVPHAECLRHDKVGHLASHFGLCSCLPGYFQDVNRLCEKEEEKIVELDLGGIYSSRFNGKVGVAGSDSEEESVPIVPPKAERVKDDKSNENTKFWIPEEKLDKLAKGDSGGGTSLCSGGFLVFLSVGVIFVQLLI